MQKISLGLFAVLACTWGCGPLANDPVADDGGGGGNGGRDGTTGPAQGNDSGRPVTTNDASGQGDDGGASEAAPPGDDGGGSSDDSGAQDSEHVVPPVDSAPPPPTCSEANATWVAGAGISTSGWTATATKTATTDTNADTVPGAAFDGNLTTRWSSGAAETGGEFFRLDLGQAQSISQVVFFDTTDIPAAYTLALSTDDSTYTTVATGSGAQPTAICFTAQSARYVKLTQTATSGSWFSIYEINVFH
jgi:hypothetical protein